EIPSSLNQGKFGVTEQERDSPPEEVRFRLEVGIKDDDILAFPDVMLLQSVTQCPGLHITLRIMSVESSRTWIMILSEGHERPHAAPIDN
ncbi:hypothetical protein ACMD2_01393, partial [Ananas comosus]